MIRTLANMALDAGHDILARPEQRAVEVAKESDIYRALAGGYGASETGINVTEANALSYIPVLACTRVISETLACLPLKLYQRTATGAEVANGNYLYSLLHDAPNPEMSAFSFWEAVGVSLCLYNNFYAQLQWSNSGRLVAMWPLLPNRVAMRRTASGQIVFDYTDADRTVTFVSGDVLHIPGCLNLTGLVAQSLVGYAREAIGLGLAPQKFASTFYKNNARPGIYLQSPTPLGKEKKIELAEAWNAIHQGLQGVAKTGVVDGGIEVKTVGVTQSDAEFTKTRDFQLQETARVYRMPLHKIADLSRSTNNNIEHQGIEFSTDTMAPYCRRSEQALKLKVIGINSPFYAEFSMSAIQRGDLLSRTQAYAQAINTGQMTPNEARRLENRPSMDGGDRLYIQGANVPLEMAGQHLQQNDQPKQQTDAAS